ncbi:rhomboid family intramembrane serine protease [Gordonia crocea]|uniref:rhomboid family intramembrane serine protease n=1 Tax=Gordonia crocea TaxID=589162 RepID=UPI001E573F62|nr:rhomboid family intramembrane serine protease [Gordonia crocea]
MATYALVAINVAVYAICVAQARTGDFYGFVDSSVFNYSTLTPGDIADHEYWRLLTSGFLHLSPIHIGVNMISLYILGTMLEPILGTGRFLLIYLISLFGGSAAVAIFAGDNTATAGASGAIYGLMGAMLVIVLKLKAPAGQVIAIIAINLLLSITVPGISLVGHVGGLVFGALATALALYIPDLVIGRQTPTVPLRKRATGTAWAALVVALVVAVALGIAAPALR